MGLGPNILQARITRHFFGAKLQYQRGWLLRCGFWLFRRHFSSVQLRRSLLTIRLILIISRPLKMLTCLNVRLRYILDEWCNSSIQSCQRRYAIWFVPSNALQIITVHQDDSAMLHLAYKAHEPDLKKKMFISFVLEFDS